LIQRITLKSGSGIRTGQGNGRKRRFFAGLLKVSALASQPLSEALKISCAAAAVTYGRINANKV
jgi:hypothetical protein